MGRRTGLTRRELEEVEYYIACQRLSARREQTTTNGRYLFAGACVCALVLLLAVYQQAIDRWLRERGTFRSGTYLAAAGLAIAVLFFRQRKLWKRGRGGRALAELAAAGLCYLNYKLVVRGELGTVGEGIAYLAGGGLAIAVLFFRQRGLWKSSRGSRAVVELTALVLCYLSYKLTVRGMLWMLGKGIAYLAGGGLVVLLVLWAYDRQERIWAANPRRRKADLMWAGAAVTLPFTLLLLAHLLPALLASVKSVGAALAGRWRECAAVCACGAAAGFICYRLFLREQRLWARDRRRAIAEMAWTGGTLVLAPPLLLMCAVVAPLVIESLSGAVSTLSTLRPSRWRECAIGIGILCVAAAAGYASWHVGSRDTRLASLQQAEQPPVARLKASGKGHPQPQQQGSKQRASPGAKKQQQRAAQQAEPLKSPDQQQQLPEKQPPPADPQAKPPPPQKQQQKHEQKQKQKQKQPSERPVRPGTNVNFSPAAPPRCEAAAPSASLGVPPSAAPSGSPNPQPAVNSQPAPPPAEEPQTPTGTSALPGQGRPEHLQARDPASGSEFLDRDLLRMLLPTPSTQPGPGAASQPLGMPRPSQPASAYLPLAAGGAAAAPAGEGTASECVVCMDAAPQTDLAPCGHRVLCLPCTLKLLEDARSRSQEALCPYCREEVVSYIKRVYHVGI